MIDVSETRNPSWVQLIHFFGIAREARVMGSHLNDSLDRIIASPSHHVFHRETDSEFHPPDFGSLSHQCEPARSY